MRRVQTNSSWRSPSVRAIRNRRLTEMCGDSCNLPCGMPYSCPSHMVREVCRYSRFWYLSTAVTGPSPSIRYDTLSNMCSILERGAYRGKSGIGAPIFQGPRVTPSKDSLARSEISLIHPLFKNEPR